MCFHYLIIALKYWLHNIKRKKKLFIKVFKKKMYTNVLKIKLYKKNCICIFVFLQFEIHKIK
jgi:ribosomal protein L25 (general stress protein Ctc)